MHCEEINQNLSSSSHYSKGVFFAPLGLFQGLQESINFLATSKFLLDLGTYPIAVYMVRIFSSVSLYANGSPFPSNIRCRSVKNLGGAR